MPSIFSQILAGEAPGAIVHQTPHCAVLMDAFPTLPGHALVIAKTECTHVQQLPEAVRAELLELALAVAKAQAAAGFSSGDSHFLLNNGPQADQTVPHVHWHVVPRRAGDGFPFPALAGNLARKWLGRKTPLATLEAHGLRLQQHLEWV